LQHSDWGEEAEEDQANQAFLSAKTKTILDGESACI
jgi:hypothetical protein